MPLDAICLSFLATELRETLLGVRIDKIYQPSRDEIILAVRASDGAKQVLLSANSARPRVQFTQIKRENPQKPPMFCMLLRKHLIGGRIVDILQPNLERLLVFQIQSMNELGDIVEKRLIVEVMGRHSNLILVGEDGRISDCLRRVSETSSGRQVLPGMFYRYPAAQDKYNPLELNDEMLQQIVEKAPEDQPLDKYLVETFAGVSPLVAREIAFEVAGSTDAVIDNHGDALVSTLTSLVEEKRSGAPTPYMILRDGKPADFSYRPIVQYGSSVELCKMDSFSHMFDVFYAKKEQGERMRQKGQELIRTVTTMRDRISRKLLLQAKELEKSENREDLREKGDIIISNLYCMEKGMKELKTINFYDPDSAEIKIQLDPLLSPQQNASRYYKNYNKAKTAESMLSEQIEKGTSELAYLNSVLDSISRAEKDSDLDEIRLELEREGYIRSRSRGKVKIKNTASKPLEFISSTGFRISVGKNNTQNDILTNKMAGRFDIWFHVQSIHGSHVILWTDGKEVDEESMTQACMLAVWFSQGREGNKVPVDHTLVKHIKKPSGSKPGMVIYNTYETSFVTADPNLIESLQVK